jgi:hypothetical protein
MKSCSRRRTKLTVYILVILSIYQLVQSIDYYNPAILLKRIGVYGKLPPDPITEYTGKLDCLKEDLSLAEPIGFITNTPDETFPTETYLLTQYALAPVLLKNSVDAKMVVGYFPGGIDQGTLDQDGLQIVKTCKQGIFLAKRK